LTNYSREFELSELGFVPMAQFPKPMVKNAFKNHYFGNETKGTSI